MNYYLIDYENIRPNSEEIRKILKGSRIFIFYSKNCKIPNDLMKMIAEEKTRFELHYVGTGTKNALDFQL